ncbi:uncharacterized protein Bfra_001140 [Botrytis fragariae]|uniref:Uncharacterized protein n=1 Tax=Botrytis fragariae TaxID=1964551 RepID=A0A8H6B4Q2_9HELO|nr:uncharacterized protein Bfra_001140 [Botrytis fragariae]KAF5878967.1 hypothetical protein Bfra_001140 [Botrytis fragariae]
MGNNKSPNVSMDTAALPEKDTRISADDKQSHSPVTSLIENPALVLDLRLLPLESSPASIEIASQAPKPKNICALPIDVLAHLADALPPDTAALLSISCKTMWRTLGSKYVGALNNPYRAVSFPVHAMYRRNLNIQLDRSYRYNFLRLLARDLPNHITCYPCNKLHMFGPAYGQNLLVYSCAFHVDNALPLLEGYVSFHILQAAMKRYHQRHITLSIPLYDETITFLSPTSQLVECSREAIHISHTTNSIIVRKQRILLLPANHHYASYEDPDASISWDYPICPHLKWDCFYDFRARQLSVSDRSLASPRFQSCDYCMTDYHIAVQDRNEEGDVLYLTRWQDLGSGESPREFNWQNAIANGTAQGQDKVSRYAYEHGSVCEAFERVPGERFEFDESMREQDWEIVNRYPVSRARDMQRERGKGEKKLPLKILTARDDAMVRAWFE